MGSRADRREAGSYLETSIEHLPKPAFSPAHDPRNEWKREVENYRRGLARFGPIIRPPLQERLPDLCRCARRSDARSMEEHREPEAADMLPEHCPWTLERLLDPSFEPAWRWRLRGDRCP